MPKAKTTQCRATSAPANATFLPEEARVIEAARWVRNAYQRQRANDSRGLWMMLRELSRAVDEADAARARQS